MLEFYNVESLTTAKKQQKQLLYFINSKLQDDRVDNDYIKQWASRKYQSSDYFLNWIKSIFNTEIFLNFFKYLRHPLPSAKLIKDQIEPQLKRVFNAEDAYYRYNVNNKDTSEFIKDLNIKEFNEDVFKALIYYPNSVIISDLEDINKSYRYIVNIDRIKSIQYEKKSITSIVFSGVALDENGEEHEGLIYIDSEKYQLYKDKDTLLRSVNHDLGRCPAHFIVNDSFNDDFIVKESLFSFVRSELEEYVFLKTLQKMKDANGAFPVVVKLKTDSKDETNDIDSNSEFSSDMAMSSQRSSTYATNPPVNGDLSAGMIHDIEAPVDSEGNVNTDVITNYMNLIHFPTDILNYIDTRIKSVENDIISRIIGDVVESSEESKNELQIKKSISVLENKLSSLSDKLNRIRKLSDTDMLGLEFGIDSVIDVTINYGTDFFLETQEQLISEFEKAPNPLERKNIIVRMNQNRYKNNPDYQTRSVLLYDIIPYVSDKDFEKAGEKVSEINFELYTRFDYWISQFEAAYGDIVQFYKDEDGTKEQKLRLINNLIYSLIKSEKNEEKNDLAKDS